MHPRPSARPFVCVCHAPDPDLPKSEILFCSAPPHTYNTPSTFDGADLSHVLLPNNRFMPVVPEFLYLGDTMARDGSDGSAVECRISAAGKAFGALRNFVLKVIHAIGSRHDALEGTLPPQRRTRSEAGVER